MFSSRHVIHFILLLIGISIGYADCNCFAEEDIKKSFFEGYDLLQKGKVLDAIPFFEQAIKDSPEHAPVYSKLAECCEKLGRYAEAEPLWGKYVELRPSQEDVIGPHLDYLKKIVEAEKILEDLRKFPPKTNRTIKSKKEIVPGVPDPTATDDDVEEEENPREKIWEKAEPLLMEEAADNYRGSFIAMKAIVLILPRIIKQEKFHDALDMISRMEKEYPELMSPKMHLWWGMALRGTGAYLDGIGVLQKTEELLDDEPLLKKKCRRELALCHMGVAQALIANGKNLAAREVLKRIRENFYAALTNEETISLQKCMTACEASQVSEWIKMGDSYAKQGMYEDAVRWYKKVRTLSFSNIYTLKAEERIRSLEGLGRQFIAKIDKLTAEGNYAQAMALAERMEGGFHKDIRIKAMRAYARAATAAGQFDLAAQKLFAIAERYPDSDEGIMAYAEVGYTYGIYAGDPEKGLKVFSAMLTWRTDDSRVERESQLGTGIMLAILKRKSQAIKLLTAVAIKWQCDSRIKKLCTQYIWKCKNCKDISLKQDSDE